MEDYDCEEGEDAEASVAGTGPGWVGLVRCCVGWGGEVVRHGKEGVGDVGAEGGEGTAKAGC